MKKEIFGIKAPAKPEVEDKNCPFYGTLAVKKEFIEGKVIKKDINRSATVEWDRSHYVPKYERYEMRRSRVRVHNPTSVDAKIGDRVLCARCRPLSKTKNFVILKVIDENESN